MKKLFLVLIIFSLTGCWNYRELNELAMTTGVAIDKVKDGYKMTILIANSKKNGSSGNEQQAATVVYEGIGKTIFEAGKNVALEVSKQVYASHIEVLIISEEIAHNDLIDTIDFMFRYPQIRNEFYVVIADDCKAGDVLKITMPLESFPSQNISKNLELTNKLQGEVYAITFNHLIKDILDEGIDPILPTINIIGEVKDGNDDENIKKNMPDTYLKLGFLALLRNDKLVAISDLSESTGIDVLNNNITTMLITSEYESGNAVIEVNSLETKFDFVLNEIPEVNINITVDGALQEVSADLNLKDEKVIEMIKNKTIDKLKETVNKAITLAQNNKSDIFGIGNKIYKKDYKYWNTVKDSWEDTFSKIKFNIKADISMETKGNISNTIKEK